MKWLPRSKKSLLLLIPVILLAAGLVYFIIWTGQKNDDTSNSAATGEVKEVKTDDIFLALKESPTHSEFNSFISAVDFNSKLVANAAGALPKLIIFAPSNAAFKKPDVAPLATTPEPGKDEIKLYHAAILYPDAEGKRPSLSLSDGQKITTLAGRELHVKKVGSSFALVDVKGRQSKVDLSYMIDAKGYRLYFVDSVLLLQ